MGQSVEKKPSAVFRPSGASIARGRNKTIAAGKQERSLLLWTTSLLLKTTPEALQGADVFALRQWRNILDTALLRERNRGIERHYRYSLNRHIALKQACELIVELQNARTRDKNPASPGLRGIFTSLKTS